MKEEAFQEPVFQNTSIGVPCGDVDTAVEETGMEVEGKRMKQAPLKLYNTWMGIDHNLG